MSQFLTEDQKYMKHCLSILASDSMGGREPGTKYDKMASDFIASEFRLAKIKPWQSDNYFQEFTYLKDFIAIKTRNVVASINNKAACNILITAHYDHLGLGGKRSRSYGKHDVHNGADDNASGVALMLVLAHRIKALANKNFNFIFVSFSGHEDGLYGSNYFENSGLVCDSNISFVINLDMVGRADTINPVVFVASSDTNLAKEFKMCIKDTNQISVKITEMPEGDHSPFISKNIPALILTTGMEDDYHKVSDKENLINNSAMLTIEKLVLSFLNNKNLTH